MCFCILIHCPEDFRDAALLVERREGELLQLEGGPVYGWRERADGNLDRPVHEEVAYHQEGQKLRQHHVWLGPHDHRMRRADAVELRHGQLALVGAAAAKKEITLAKAQFGADDIATLAPAADLQVLRVKMLQPHIDFIARLARLDALVDVLGELAKRQPLPFMPLDPCGQHLGWLSTESTDFLEGVGAEDG